MDPTIQPRIQRDQGGNRMVFGSGSTLVMEAGAKKISGSGNGSSPVPGAATILEEFDGSIHRSIFTFNAFVIQTVDHVAAGAHGSLPLYTFPRGSINILGGVASLAIVGDGTGLIPTAALVAAVGSTPTAITDATLTTTEADIIPSANAPLVANNGNVKAVGSVSKNFDNTTFTNAAPLTANLNFAAPDASSIAVGSVTVTGTVQFSWYNLGDM